VAFVFIALGLGAFVLDQKSRRQNLAKSSAKKK